MLPRTLSDSREYHYLLVDGQGRYHNISRKAAGLEEALALLEDATWILLDIREAAPPGLAAERLMRWRRQPGDKVLAVFCRQLQAMLKAGLPLIKSLMLLARQEENRRLSLILAQVCDDLEQGCTLAGALDNRNGFFPPIVIQMIAAGEAGGMVEEVLGRLAEHYERRFELSQKIRASTAYPKAVALIALAVIVFLCSTVLPVFADNLQLLGVPLPAVTSFLLNLGYSLRRFWYLWLIAAGSLLGAFAALLRTKSGGELGERIACSLPVAGTVYRRAILCRFCRTLGSLLASGVSLLSSLELSVRAAGSRALLKSLPLVKEEVLLGRPLAGALAGQDFFEPLVVEMITIGEETGNLAGMLEQCAELYEGEIAHTVERLGKLLEPVMIIVLSLVVGFIIFSVLLPLLKLYQAV